MQECYRSLCVTFQIIFRNCIMKVSEQNYNKIKKAITQYAGELKLDVAELTLGNFFHLHSNAVLIKEAPEAYPRYYVNNKPVFEKDENYEYYPDDSNDNHLETVYKRIIKEANTL